MSRHFYIVSKDRAPALEPIALNFDGTPIDLTGASAKLYMMDRADLTVLVIDGGDLEIPEPLAGKMRYLWAADDLVEGQYVAEVRVTLAGGAIVTIPGDDWYYIHVRKSLTEYPTP